MHRAVRLGQGWMPNFQSPQELRGKLHQLKEMLLEAGSDNPMPRVAVGCKLSSDPLPSQDSLSVTDQQQLVDAVGAYEAIGVEMLVLLSPREPNLDTRLAPFEQFASHLLT